MNFPPFPTKTIVREHIEKIHDEKEEKLLNREKFVDDVTIGEAVPKEKLALKTNKRTIGPLPLRTVQILSSPHLHHYCKKK